MLYTKNKLYEKLREEAEEFIESEEVEEGADIFIRSFICDFGFESGILNKRSKKHHERLSHQ
jgi:predicted house-cleaning noncanonical NTP pyrophosphatase (MazG superfamily)